MVGGKAQVSNISLQRTHRDTHRSSKHTDILLARTVCRPRVSLTAMHAPSYHNAIFGFGTLSKVLDALLHTACPFVPWLKYLPASNDLFICLSKMTVAVLCAGSCSHGKEVVPLSTPHPATTSLQVRPQLLSLHLRT